MSNTAVGPTAEFLSIKQVAALINVSPSTIRRLVGTPAFPTALRLGSTPRGTIRFRREDIDRWILKAEKENLTS